MIAVFKFHDVDAFRQCSLVEGNELSAHRIVANDLRGGAATGVVLHHVDGGGIVIC